jgi:hypothetical protein
MELLEGCQEFLEEYIENGLRRAISADTELANDLQIEPEFQSVKRLLQVKRHFHRKSHNEPAMTPEKTPEIEVFNTLLDTGLMSTKEGFEQLHQHAESNLRFLYKIRELPKKIRTYKTLFRSSFGI